MKSKLKGVLEIVIGLIVFISLGIVMPWDMPKENVPEVSPPEIVGALIPTSVNIGEAGASILQRNSFVETPSPFIREPITTWPEAEYIELKVEEAESVSAEEETGAYEEYVEPGPLLTYIGNFDVTAYEWTGNPCANGNYPTEGYTVACNSLPLGTEVYLEGIGYRVVEDRGATWHSDNWMDLYLGDVSSCYAWGVQSIGIYIVE